jgi:uncharacterized protein YkwD
VPVVRIVLLVSAVVLLSALPGAVSTTQAAPVKSASAGTLAGAHERPARRHHPRRRPAKRKAPVRRAHPARGHSACAARNRRTVRGHQICLTRKNVASSPVATTGARPTTTGDTPSTSAVVSPAAGACADGDLVPTPDNLGRVSAATMCLVDQVRAQHGLAALRYNALLQRAAQSHTDDMIAGDYFDHVGPSGDTPLDRMVLSGYISSDDNSYTVGENLAWGTLSLSTPRGIVDGWVGSPEHLANMLNPSYVDAAVAVDAVVPASMSHGQPGAMYTEEFGVFTTG